MPIDWKSRMLEATASQGVANRAAARSVVEAALHNGAGLADVQQFVAQQPALSAVAALFADGFGDLSTPSKKAQDALGGDLRAAGGTGFRTQQTRRVHDVRVDPEAALPWFHKLASVSLPAPLTGTGTDVVVDGERFSANDIATLLRAA